MKDKLPRTTMMIVALTALALLAQLALAQVTPAQAPLNPTKIPQFVDPLPHFAGLRVDAKTGGNLTVEMVPHKQIAVSTGTNLALGTVGPLSPTVGLANFWTYKITGGNYPAGTQPMWPAFTIEARKGNPLSVSYINNLVGETYANVNLVVDQTIHWADPDMAPMPPPMVPYVGTVPATVHLHGGEVPPWSDGGPNSWYTPLNAIVGNAYHLGAYSYPNSQEAATLWYHDHTLGATRLNVYAGLAGFYLLRDVNEDALKLPGFSGDGLVQEVAPPGKSGTFNTLPYLPEIEVAIQDRMFDTNGGLYFPNLPTNPLIHPFWTPEFVGDIITVNGKTWPYLSVAPRKYRFRILNGSNARFYNLSFPKGGPQITQIGTDGGFLDVPVLLAGPLLLAPGERADVIIDFAPFAPVPTKKGGAKVSSFVLGNDARTPFPGGRVVSGLTTGRIMEFVVNGTMPTPDASVIPAALKGPSGNVKLANFAAMTPAANVTVANTRQLTLNEVMGAGGPLEILVNNSKWAATVTETPTEGSTEIWQIINLTADAHPMHLHLVQFQLISRQPFNVKAYNAAYNLAFPGGVMTDPMTGLPMTYAPGVFMPGFGPPLNYSTGVAGFLGGNPDPTPFLTPLAARTANPNEQGWKDTFIMYPGEVTTIIARWAPTDLAVSASPAALKFPFDPSTAPGYVWHCHIVDHEDNEMMRPYAVALNPSRGVALAAAERNQANASDNGDLLAADTKPVRFAVEQNYPNPFNPSTEIRFSIPADTHVRLTIYNTVGQEILRLIDAEAQAGNHTVKLNAERLASGVYFYRLEAGQQAAMKQMVLIK